MFQCNERNRTGGATGYRTRDGSVAVSTACSRRASAGPRVRPAPAAPLLGGATGRPFSSSAVAAAAPGASYARYSAASDGYRFATASAASSVIFGTWSSIARHASGGL
eukprot:EG_transcript_35565